MNKHIPYPVELITERLIIRSPSLEDATVLRDAIEESIEELKVWMPWADHIPSLEESLENCSMAVENFKKGKDYRLHIFLKEPNIFLGGSGLHRADWSVPKFEIGYWIRTSYAGKGYVTEAVKKITEYAMEELKAKRIEIMMSTKNEKSWHVAKRAGYTFEGVLRNHCRNIDGTLRDTKVYSIVSQP